MQKRNCLFNNNTVHFIIGSRANTDRSRSRLGLGLLMFLFVLNLCPLQVSAEIYGQYVGWETCVDCHDEISRSWRQTRHAKTFENLLRSGQQDLPACLRCHVVGYNDRGGFLDRELTPELSGIQCESCHGPGIRHIDTLDDIGDNIRLPNENDCRTCHTIGQDPNFDFQKKVALVHGVDATGSSGHPAQSPDSRVNSTLFIDKTTHALPPIQEGAPAIVYTRVKNSGEEAIRITDVISS